MAEFKVWWIPQVPMEMFEVEVPDLDTGILVCNILANYDLFQYKHNVKPDYSNAGGIRYRLSDRDEWEDVDYEDEADLVYVREQLELGPLSS